MNKDDAENEVKKPMQGLERVLNKMHAEEDKWFAKHFGEQYAVQNRKNYHTMVAWLKKDLARVFGVYPDEHEEFHEKD